MNTKFAPDDLRVTIADCRDCGFCASGVRKWLVNHGLDMREMIDRGIPVSQIEATGDALGLRAAAKARERIGGTQE